MDEETFKENFKEELRSYLRDNLKIFLRKDPVFDNHLEVVLKLGNEAISYDSIDISNVAKVKDF